MISAIQRVDPLENPDWDAQVERCAAGAFFHGAAWARVLQATYGYTPVYFSLVESGRLQALLPVMEVTSWLTGRRGVSLPFTDECEPLGADPVAFGRVFEEVLAHAEQRGWNYLEFRGGRRLIADAPASTSYLGHHLDLRAGEPQLFANLEGAVRRAIHKAERSGLRVEFARSREATRIFYGLQCRTRRRHGLPPQPWHFFENVHRLVLEPERGWVVLAWRGREPVAGAVFFQAGTQAWYKYGASDERHQQLRANDLVMWEGIRWFASHGFERLGLGRTSLGNDGLRRFKLGWGAQEYGIDYVRYDRRAGGFVTARDAVGGWYNRVFRVLPAPLSRLAGTVLYKHAA